jgi:flagellar biosynthesis/type III secretory pathway M-ring protein FliF/YscJ
LNNSQTKKKVTQSQYELSRVMSNTMLAAGGIKRLSAAVFIAQKMEGEGKDRKPVARSDEEIQKLKRIVQSALGIQEPGARGQETGAGPTRNDEITVEQIPFNDQPAVELSQQLQTDGQRQFYWEIGRNVFFALLALGMLAVFLKLLKKTSGDIPVNLPLDPADEAASSRRRPPGLVTVEALNSLIRENPASVGQAVRSWLGTGGGGKSN